MAYVAKLIRAAIRAEIVTLTNFPAGRIINGGVPTLENLVRQPDGQIKPYLITNWYRPIRQGGASFEGARGHEYVQKLDIMCVAQVADDAESLADKIENGLLGLHLADVGGGEMNLTPGFGTFTVLNAQGLAEAFVATSSFRTYIGTLELDDTPTP